MPGSPCVLRLTNPCLSQLLWGGGSGARRMQRRGKNVTHGTWEEGRSHIHKKDLTLTGQSAYLHSLTSELPTRIQVQLSGEGRLGAACHGSSWLGQRQERRGCRGKRQSSTNTEPEGGQGWSGTDPESFGQKPLRELKINRD